MFTTNCTCTVSLLKFLFVIKYCIYRLDNFLTFCFQKLGALLKEGYQEVCRCNLKYYVMTF